MTRRVWGPAAPAIFIAGVRWPFFSSLKTSYKNRTLSKSGPTSIQRISNAFGLSCRPRLKESVNKFKGGALCLEELF